MNPFKKIQGWLELTRMTGGKPFIVERIRILETDIAIEGAFELSPLVRLSEEDQIFMAAFVKSHGSIKQMEKIFGVSYPTIKNRLNRIGEQLSFLTPEVIATREHSDEKDVLSQLEQGTITVAEALEKLK